MIKGEHRTGFMSYNLFFLIIYSKIKKVISSQILERIKQLGDCVEL